MKTITSNLFKVLFFAMISVSLLLTPGCDDDDDIDAIVGTWKVHEVDMTVAGVTATVPPSQLGMDITVLMNVDKTYTATAINTTEDGVNTVVESGTWNRSDGTTVVITSAKGTHQTLTKEGDFYVTEQTYEATELKLKFKKQ